MFGVVPTVVRIHKLNDMELVTFVVRTPVGMTDEVEPVINPALTT